MIFGVEFEGRLGFYHFVQRIVKTLRQGHIDYGQAIWDLSMAIYEYEPKSYDELLEAFRNGYLRNGKKCSESDIEKIRLSSDWKKYYTKYLMKIIRPASVIR